MFEDSGELWVTIATTKLKLVQFLSILMTPPLHTHTRLNRRNDTTGSRKSIYLCVHCPTQDSWLEAWGAGAGKIKTYKKESTLLTPTK